MKKEKKIKKCDQVEVIVCYDANTTVTSTVQFCPICGSKKEIEYNSVPELKVVIIECCSGDKYEKTRKMFQKRVS